MIRKSVWHVVCIWIMVAGCRSFHPAGRALVRAPSVQSREPLEVETPTAGDGHRCQGAADFRDVRL